MAWITYFKAANMTQPLFDDLANETFFHRTSTLIDVRTIDYAVGSTTVVDTIFRGNFSVSGSIILGGNIRSVTKASNGIVSYTLTGLAPNALDIWDTLDVASHRDATALNQWLLSGNDRVDGSAFADTLDGAGGIDTMSGGLGNDTYVVDSSTDVIVELPGAGTDTVLAAVSYVLPDAVERLTLSPGSAVNGTGNDLGNRINGNSMANVLVGLDGNDTLVGGSGDDTLDGGAGNDSLDGSAGTNTVSYAAGDAGVTVNLSVATPQNTGGSGTDTIVNVVNLVGSDFADHLTGSAGNNIIEGGAGDDTLDGGAGIDTLSYASAGSDSGVTVDLSVSSPQNTIGAGMDTLLNFENLLGSAGNDVLTGDGGNNLIRGGAGGDIIDGGAGNDILDGGSSNSILGLGSDTLTGGAGADAFAFTDPTAIGGEIMTITDFVSGTDHIDLSRVLFAQYEPGYHKGIGPLGVLAPALFESGAGLTAANSENDRLLYDTNNGNLYYDANGSFGGDNHLIATLVGHPVLIASDIHVI